MADNPKTLVSTDWLAQHLKDPDLRLLDASWYLPDAGRDPKAEYNQAHIPGARFFDIDEISDGRSDMPHMAPPAEKFMSRMRAMGVGDGHQVVVYDGAGLLSAARVWWLFRLMGQENVAVLDGGLPKWVAEGRPTEDMPPIPRDRHMTVRFQNQLVRDVTQVAQASKLKAPQIVDARAAARFRGDAPEPREGLRAGHILTGLVQLGKDVIKFTKVEVLGLAPLGKVMFDRSRHGMSVLLFSERKIRLINGN